MNTKITFFNLFEGKSKSFYLLLGFMGLIDSAWSASLLFLINHKIANKPLPFFTAYDWQIYTILLVISFAVSAYFQTYLFKLTFNFGKELVLKIFNHLRFASLEKFRQVGEDKVRTAMEDVQVLESFPNLFLAFFKSAITVAIGAIYLFWIDAKGGLFVMGILFLLMVIYIFRNVKIEKLMDTARGLNDVYMQNVFDFLGGFRQLKMSVKRNDNFFQQHLTVNRNAYVSYQLKAMLKALGNELVGSYSFYVIIGVILFLLPAIFNTPLYTNITFITTVLFIMGPVGAVVGLLKSFVMVAVSINRINEFNNTLKEATNLRTSHGKQTVINNDFESIHFADVTFAYEDEQHQALFALQPVNFEINKGDVIFITGGNGSGKSTFIYLLAGLLSPKRGHIYLNDRSITDENRTYYRDQLSCIFSDHFLFSQNYDGFDLSDNNPVFVELVNKMQLEAVIRMKNGNQLDHNLSQGQKKRIALIYAMLEDKDVFIFDEWAAEQDPEFRRYFYNYIIPDLKRKGKTVIAITHDDKYFHKAERLVRFDYGKLTELTKVEETTS